MIYANTESASNSLTNVRQQIKNERKRIEEEVRKSNEKIWNLIYFNVKDLVKIIADYMSVKTGREFGSYMIVTRYTERPGGDIFHDNVDYWEYWWFFADKAEEQDYQKIFYNCYGHLPNNAPKSFISFFSYRIPQEPRRGEIISEKEAMNNIPEPGVSFFHIKNELDCFSNPGYRLFYDRLIVDKNWFTRNDMEPLKDFIDYLLDNQFMVGHRLSYEEMKPLLKTYLQENKNESLVR